ncbi:MAG TPA: prolyl oligopeptidase family serine peptidase [Anaerolineales bacterium]
MATKTFTYPKTPTGNQKDDYHGISVTDPYRWLEDVDSPETLAWVKAQNELTFGYLEQIPARDRLRKHLTSLWDFSRAMTIHHRGNHYFQFRNSGLQNQDVLYVMDSPTDHGRALLDPNTFGADGTAALNTWSVSEDGSWLAYAISFSGSDWVEWRIRNVISGEDLPEILEWSKFSGAAWAHDGSGFYYCRYAAPTEGEVYQEVNYNQTIYFHHLNTMQRDDILVYARADQPEWGFGPEVSNDGRYLAISVSQGTDTRNRFFYKDLQTNGEVIELIPDLEAAYYFIGNDGPVFYFQTDRDAPKSRMIAINITCPEQLQWKTVIPEVGDTLETATIINNQFVTIYLHDAHELLKRFALDGTSLGEIQLPTLGSVTYGYASTLAGRRVDKEMFYLFHSFAYPVTVFRYDFEKGKSEEIFKPSIHFDFNPYITRQVFVTSKDGTKVPMFLIHRADMKANSKNPTLLYGYGGFNISQTPVFAVSRLAWLELGGVYAVAILRGGGEYGEEWHKGGMIHAKQNVFDDFTACAEWLIDENITSTPKLAIEGRSNGGLLVGACMTQRPDLYGACLPIVGVMDMLRFQKFTIGWAWVSDYGSSDNLEEFNTLYSYSPYHNLKPGTKYPPTLITTGDHDDRVVPGHSFKFAARLQACQAGESPTLIRIQTKAGHGPGKPTTIIIEELADIYAFLVKNLGME